MSFADLDTVIERARLAWRPPPRLTLSEWAERHFVLSAESAAEPGRWKSLPYQVGIMDAITDPRVEQVSLMKSARIGYTLMMSAAIGYYIHQDPSSVLVVQPTVDDSKNFSKETIAPMLRDVPVLAEIRYHDLEDKGPKSSSNTLTHKAFPGGVLSLIGANSGSGFRRISRRVVMFDEVDAYPHSAGSEGDPIRLGMMRSQAFWNRKIIAGSTPLVGGSSRISEMFEAGDQRRFFVPCPHCGSMDFLVFREGDRGHFMQWPKDRPREAYFVCKAGGCIIEHKDKHWMIERGEWRADAPFRGHASFHLWAAYSYSPNAAWGQLAEEFVEAAKAGPEKLRTVVNTLLGETWVEKGDAPDWMRLHQRKERAPYQRGEVPAGVVFLTAGVDVQKDRLVWEVVGWGHDRQSWSIDADVLPGDTAKEETWAQLDELLSRTWMGGGLAHSIHMLGVDSGFNTQVVYNWARRHPMSRVIACKGVSSARVLLGPPSAVDVSVRGKRMARGYKVWPIGVDIAKAELYGWLHLEAPEGAAPYAPGFCHFPDQYPEEFFRQITAEHLVEIRSRKGFTLHEWQMIPGRQNHWLDCRVYARAAAARAGLDRHAAEMLRAPAPAPVVHAPPAAAPPSSPPPAAPEAPPTAVGQAQGPARSSWLTGGRGATVGGSLWLRRRR